MNLSDAGKTNDNRWQWTLKQEGSGTYHHCTEKPSQKWTTSQITGLGWDSKQHYSSPSSLLPIQFSSRDTSAPAHTVDV